MPKQLFYSELMYFVTGGCRLSVAIVGSTYGLPGAGWHMTSVLVMFYPKAPEVEAGKRSATRTPCNKRSNSQVFARKPGTS